MRVAIYARYSSENQSEKSIDDQIRVCQKYIEQNDHTHSEDLIFTEASLQKAVERIKDTRSACEFGIRRELDSILYYQEIKSFTPEEEKDIIDDIIKEERSHFLKLTEVKRGL